MKPIDKEYPFDYDATVVQNTNEVDLVPFGKAGTVVFIEKTGSRHNTLVVDMDSKMIYYSDFGNFTFDARLAEYQGKLDRTNYKQLEEIFEKYHVKSFEKEYIGTNNGTTARYEWVLNIEHKGKVERHYGYGAFGNNKPESFSGFKDELLAFAKSNTQNVRK